jgi:hypothetical protein
VDHICGIPGLFGLLGSLVLRDLCEFSLGLFVLILFSLGLFVLILLSLGLFAIRPLGGEIIPEAGLDANVAALVARGIGSKNPLLLLVPIRVDPSEGDLGGCTGILKDNFSLDFFSNADSAPVFLPNLPHRTRSVRYGEK